MFGFLGVPIQQETPIYTIYINLHNLHTLFMPFLSWFDNNVILIGHSNQCVQNRRTRGVPKIERFGQRLTHRACMGKASSYSWAPLLFELNAQLDHIFGQIEVSLSDPQEVCVLVAERK